MRVSATVTSWLCVTWAILFCAGSSVLAGEFTGTVLDADTDEQLPARVYVRSADGEWLFVESASPDGSALAYREQWVPIPGSVERHTTVSAHPFHVDLAPGKYTITIERGKE